MRGGVDVEAWLWMHRSLGVGAWWFGCGNVVGDA